MPAKPGRPKLIPLIAPSRLTGSYLRQFSESYALRVVREREDRPMFVTFRLGSLVKLLVLTAVGAALIGMLLAGLGGGPRGPDVVRPTTSVPQTQQDLGPLSGVQPRRS
jgi:hypothetical protein